MSKEQIKFVGLDVFVISEGAIPKLPEKLAGCELVQVTNRGTKVWPGKAPPIEMTDVFTCRYQCAKDQALDEKAALEILTTVSGPSYAWVHAEKLLQINGVNRFT